MINGISNYRNNSPAFTGINKSSIINFIPNIAPETANKLSAEINLIIPHDHLEMMLKGGKIFTHTIEYNGMKIPVGDVKYVGEDTIVGKIAFLHDVADMIKQGTIYA